MLTNDWCLDNCKAQSHIKFHSQLMDLWFLVNDTFFLVMKHKVHFDVPLKNSWLSNYVTNQMIFSWLKIDKRYMFCLFLKKVLIIHKFFLNVLFCKQAPNVFSANSFLPSTFLQIADLHSLHRDLVPYVSWIKSLDLPPSNPKSIFGGIRSSSTSNAGKAGMWKAA